MKKRLFKILCLVIILLGIFICGYKGVLLINSEKDTYEEKPLINAKMDCNKIDKVQVMIPKGNISKGFDSKVITDPSEIEQFVYIFNTVSLVKKVPKEREEISAGSVYKFYSGDELINTLEFNGCDSKRIYEGNYISHGHEITIKNVSNDKEPKKIGDENSQKVLDIILDNWSDASEYNIFDCGYNYEISIDEKKYYFCLHCRSIVGDGVGIILNKDDFNNLREICGMYTDYKY